MILFLATRNNMASLGKIFNLIGFSNPKMDLKRLYLNFGSRSKIQKSISKKFSQSNSFIS